MALRRGFRVEATALATELRGELDLDPFDRLDPFVLAAHLDVPVMALSDLTATCSEAHHFIDVEPDAFSALTVFEGRRRIIVHNDTHSPPRQHSNIAHELAHCVLHHPPAHALDPLTGCRLWRSDHEDEANWLTGELLVTRQLALAVARGKVTRESALARLGISRPMLQWRINATGAGNIARREQASGGSKSS